MMLTTKAKKKTVSGISVGATDATFSARVW